MLHLETNHHQYRPQLQQQHTKQSIELLLQNQFMQNLVDDLTTPISPESSSSSPSSSYLSLSYSSPLPASDDDASNSSTIRSSLTSVHSISSCCSGNSSSSYHHHHNSDPARIRGSSSSPTNHSANNARILIDAPLEYIERNYAILNELDLQYNRMSSHMVAKSTDENRESKSLQEPPVLLSNIKSILADPPPLTLSSQLPHRFHQQQQDNHHQDRLETLIRNKHKILALFFKLDVSRQQQQIKDARRRKRSSPSPSPSSLFFR